MKIRGAPKPGTGGSPARNTRARDIGFAVASCAALAAYNNVINRHRWHHERYVALNAGATAAALAAAAASGLTAADLGFAREQWPPGRLATGLAAGAAAGWLLVAVVPAARPVLKDKRISSLKGRAVAYQAVVRIPIGTVLWEETAFRGVLQAGLRRVMPQTPAIVVTSAVFGIWHIRPTLQALRANGLATDRRQATARLAAGVAATTASGVLLSWLRARSGSLAAPVLLHLATNSGGMAAAWAAEGLSTRRELGRGGGVGASRARGGGVGASRARGGGAGASRARGAG